MKNTEIHDSLPDSEVRTFLSKSLSRHYYPGKIEHLKADRDLYADKLAAIDSEIKKCEISDGLNGIIELKGWSIFDVSDHITDNIGEDYFNFIGTSEELRDLGIKDN